MAEKVCVVGGTGMLGRPVVRHLMEEGFAVRVLTRERGKAARLFGGRVEEAQGRVEEPESLGRALEGCFGVHINLLGGPSKADFFRVETDGARNIAAAARRMGLERITMTSGMMVSSLSERELRDPASRAYPVIAKHYAEEAVRQSGIAYTIFRPTGFTDTFALSVRGRLALDFAGPPMKVHLIAGEEYGEMVARSYTLAQAANKTYHVLGPEPLSPREALALYCEALHPGARIVSVPLWLLSLMAALSFHPLLRLGVTMLKLSLEHPEVSSDGSAERDLGPLKVTVRDYCRWLKAAREKGAEA